MTNPYRLDDEVRAEITETHEDIVRNAPLLPAGATLHATLRLNYRGRYATCESTGDPRAAIRQLIEECSK